MTAIPRKPDDAARRSDRPRGPLRWGAVAVALAGAATYLPCLPNEFVWDDRANIVDNPHVQQPTWNNVAWAFSAYHLGHYQPLTWLTYLLDAALWPGRPAGYRFVNVLLHAVNAALFAHVAYRLLAAAWGTQPAGANEDRRAQWGGLVAAAAFALHPLRVESVAWITQRRDVLCGLFFLLATLAYLSAVRPPVAARSFTWLAASVLLFGLSLLAKPLGAALPVVLLALDVYPLRRWRPAVARTADGFGMGRLLCEKAGYLLVAVAVGAAALAAQSQGGALLSLADHPLSARLAQAAYGLIFYLRATFAAFAWYPLYEMPLPLHPGQTRFVLSAAAVLILAALAGFSRRRIPGVLVAGISYAALVAPVLGLFQAGPQLVADRYSYLACLPIAALAAAAVAWCAGRSTRAWRAAVTALTLLALVGWASLSIRQERTWRDEESVWRQVLAGGPSAMAYNNLGTLASNAGDYPRAATLFARSLTAMPTYRRARQNLVGILTYLSGRIDPADAPAVESALRSSLAVPPPDAGAHLAAGLLAQARGDLTAAVADFQTAARLDPGRADAWSRLGAARLAAGEPDAALEPLAQAVALDPRAADAWLGLGIVHLNRRDYPQAERALLEATRLDPDLAPAWTALGACLIQTGRAPAARPALVRALRLNPGDPRAAALLRAVDASVPVTSGPASRPGS